MFHFLGSTSAAAVPGSRAHAYNPSLAAKKERLCEVNEKAFVNELERAKIEEDRRAEERREKELQHQLRMLADPADQFDH